MIKSLFKVTYYYYGYNFDKQCQERKTATALYIADELEDVISHLRSRKIGDSPYRIISITEEADDVTLVLNK